MNIVRQIFDIAEKSPNRPAIIHRDKTITYSELMGKIASRQSYYRAKGIQSGDRVLVFIPISISLYASILALIAMGAVVVFMDDWSTPARLKRAQSLVQCKALLVESKYAWLTRFIPGLSGIPIRINSSREEETAEIGPLCLPMNEESPALITLTTGSTGMPKAANRTHHFLARQLEVLRSYVLENDDVALTNLPIIHLLHLACSKTTLIPSPALSAKRNFDAGGLWALVREHQVDSLVLSPYFLHELSGYVLQEGIDTSAIQRIICGGAPMYPQSSKRVIEGFPEADCRMVYGSTEVEPIAETTLWDLTGYAEQGNAGILAGQIHPGIELRFFDETGTEQAPEGPGEICVAGEHVLKSYYPPNENLPDNKFLYEGRVFHKTGDMGFRNPEGRLVLLGRQRQVIRWKNQVFYPFPTEMALQKLPGIAEACMIVHKGSPLLVIVTRDTKEKIAATLTSGPFEGIPFLLRKKGLPRDPRHRSKIDYDRIKI